MSMKDHCQFDQLSEPQASYTFGMAMRPVGRRPKTDHQPSNQSFRADALSPIAVTPIPYWIERNLLTSQWIWINEIFTKDEVELNIPPGQWSAICLFPLQGWDGEFFRLQWRKKKNKTPKNKTSHNGNFNCLKHKDDGFGQIKLWGYIFVTKTDYWANLEFCTLTIKKAVL